MGLRDYFTVRPSNVAIMISTEGLNRNNDSETWDSILQIGHLLGGKKVN